MRIENGPGSIDRRALFNRLNFQIQSEHPPASAAAALGRAVESAPGDRPGRRRWLLNTHHRLHTPPRIMPRCVPWLLHHFRVLPHHMPLPIGPIRAWPLKLPALRRLPMQLLVSMRPPPGSLARAFIARNFHALWRILRMILLHRNRLANQPFNRPQIRHFIRITERHRRPQRPAAPFGLCDECTSRARC